MAENQQVFGFAGHWQCYDWLCWEVGQTHDAASQTLRFGQSRSQKVYLEFQQFWNLENVYYSALIAQKV